MPPDLRQLLGSVFGVAGGAGATTVGAPTITVTTTGVPAFIQGVSEFMQQVSLRTVNPSSILSAPLFPHFLVLNSLFSLKFYPQYPIMIM